MKNIFTTIEYVAEKIKEAITGHKNDEQAHPNLSEQINVLSKDRGYLNSFMSGADLNTFTKNGIYAYSQLSANKPSQTFGYLSVSDWGKGYCRQFVQDSKNACYVRILDNNVWGDWEPLATTTKTDILCTPKAGVTIVEQKSYMVNNVVYISIMFKKTDNSAINSIFSAINVPSFARPLMEISLSVAAVDAVGNGIVNKSISCPLNTSGDIWVVSDTESVATQIRVNGVFVL